MFDFGDELILDNHKIPWLIWIQILVMFLLTLIILVSYFGFFVDDSTCYSSTFITPSSCSPNTQVSGNLGSRREIANTANNGARYLENPNSERDGSSTKNGNSFFHPCRYFKLAKQAFLKCLGLGSTSLNLRDEEHEHED